jgi:hypothetical protein
MGASPDCVCVCVIIRASPESVCANLDDDDDDDDVIEGLCFSACVNVSISLDCVCEYFEVMEEGLFFSARVSVSPDCVCVHRDVAADAVCLIVSAAEYVCPMGDSAPP